MTELNPPKTFETTRLLIRQPRASDAPALFKQYMQDAEVTRYLTWQPHKDISETQAFLAYCKGCWEEKLSFPWVIKEKFSGELIGSIHMHPRGFKVALGYVLAKAYWGKGYMTEATQAMLDWTMAQPQIFRVWAVCDADNPASARVMEKIGMTFEGRMRRDIVHPNISEEPQDTLVYAIVK